MFKYLSILLPFLLTGCFGTTVEVKEVPVYIVETIVLTVPETLLQPNRVPKPPNRELYINGDWDTKESLLINYSRSLEKELRMCVADKKAVSKNLSEKTELYKDKGTIK
jgi:hypothetical protein